MEGGLLPPSQSLLLSTLPSHAHSHTALRLLTYHVHALLSLPQWMPGCWSEHFPHLPTSVRAFVPKQRQLTVFPAFLTMRPPAPAINRDLSFLSKQGSSSQKDGQREPLAYLPGVSFQEKDSG